MYIFFSFLNLRILLDPEGLYSKVIFVDQKRHFHTVHLL